MTGIQDKFSWSAVALAAIGGGVGQGMKLTGWNMAAQAVAGNVITQGIGAATGLQKNFSWAGVAAAAIMPGVGRGLAGMTQDASALTSRVVQSTASLIVGAATRSLIEGTDFGDNIMASLPDVIGQTIGESIAGRIGGNGSTTGDGESVLDKIGDGLNAVGDFLGFDGDFGYQGPQGRSLSLTGLGDAIEDVIAPPRAVAAPQLNGSAPRGPLGDAVYRPGQDGALWTEIEAPFGLSDDSPYMDRARRYREIQAELEGRGFEDTYYFDAVGAMTANLSSSDVPFLGPLLSGLDPEVRRYANGLSQGIADNNERQFRRILDGEITETGRALDRRLVADEQAFIQVRLDALEQRNPDLFQRFIGQVNDNANMPGLRTVIDGLNFWTDPQINMAADRTRATLGGPINFANETHRNIMGDTMAQVMREYRTRQEAIRNYAPPPGPHW